MKKIIGEAKLLGWRCAMAYFGEIGISGVTYADLSKERKKFLRLHAENTAVITAFHHGHNCGYRSVGF